jgi:hypothetical protein
MPIGPYFYSTTALITSLFSKPGTISSGDQESLRGVLGYLLLHFVCPCRGKAMFHFRVS